MLDRLTPPIAALTQAIEQEAEKCPAAQRLQTHPGVGVLTALSFVLIIGQATGFYVNYRKSCIGGDVSPIGGLCVMRKQS